MGTAHQYKRIVLASRPRGWVTSDNFRIEEIAPRPLDDGQVRVRVHTFSLDPYMRGRMNDTKSYVAPQALGATMQGATVGVVVESRHAKFREGDAVRGMSGWTEYGIDDGARLEKIEVGAVPMSASGTVPSSLAVSFCSRGSSSKPLLGFFEPCAARACSGDI